MERPRLGSTDMVLSALGFGGSEIGYRRVGPRPVARLLGSALDAGLNVIDTAECYEDSEALIGRAIGSRRREGYLFTKCGLPPGGRGASLSPRGAMPAARRARTGGRPRSSAASSGASVASRPTISISSSSTDPKSTPLNSTHN